MKKKIILACVEVVSFLYGFFGSASEMEFFKPVAQGVEEFLYSEFDEKNEGNIERDFATLMGAEETGNTITKSDVVINDNDSDTITKPGMVIMGVDYFAAPMMAPAKVIDESVVDIKDNVTNEDEEKNKIKSINKEDYIYYDLNKSKGLGVQYDLTEREKLEIAAIIQKEQSTKVGREIEACLMLNIFEQKYNNELDDTKGTELHDWVKGKEGKSWFSNAEEVMNAASYNNVSEECLNIVDKVIIGGERNYPFSLNEHDIVRYRNKNTGEIVYDIVKIVVLEEEIDISKIKTEKDVFDNTKVVKTITTKNPEELINRYNYITNRTIIYNRFGAIYVYQVHPDGKDGKDDGFGYRISDFAAIKVNEIIENFKNGECKLNAKITGDLGYSINYQQNNEYPFSYAFNSPLSNNSKKSYYFKHVFNTKYAGSPNNLENFVSYNDNLAFEVAKCGRTRN